MVATAVMDSAPALWGTGRPGPALRRPDLTEVRRAELVRRLEEEPGGRIVALVAPAGSGKTTVLRQWARHDPRPFAWIALDGRHNDARRLLADVARAVDDAVGADVDADRPFVLVLDNVDTVVARPALRALRAIATDLPPHATLALGSRREPPLPLARMRVERAVAELGPSDLALTRQEILAVFAGAGHDLDRQEADGVLQLTEGWPVGVSLAARFRESGDLRRFGGADRLVAGYVRDEILADLPPDRAAFLVRTSILDVLIAPGCDALLGRTGSATLLGELAAAGLLVALDRTDERFRHHRLIGAALRAELRRSEPSAEARLHARASAWHRQAGDTDEATRHAVFAGDLRGAGDLVWAALPAAIAQGRITALEHQLAGFTPEQIAAQPPLAVAAALRDLMLGQGHMVRHWVTVAGARRLGARDADVEQALAVLRAALGDGGPRHMRDDAERAASAQSGEAPWHALCSLVAGTAARLVGDAAGAVVRLEEGARRAAVSAPHVHALCLAELAVLALERDDWEEAAALVTRARAQVDRYGLDDYGTTALVFAASAAVRAHRGRIDDAGHDLREAVRLQATLTDFTPCFDADVSLLVARAALRLSDHGVAHAHLARAARILDRAPDAAGLRGARDHVQRQLDRFGADGHAPAVSMTTAELRILGYLPTHLSFREIGERTFVSANTVKTQANAVYRKLGVSCRSDAVARARACGLLDG